MRPRRQRMAINQAEVRRRSKLLGPIARGTRAFREGLPRHANPCVGKKRTAWFSGWDIAADKQQEQE